MKRHALFSKPSLNRLRGIALAASILLSAVAAQAADTLYLLTTDGKLATASATNIGQASTPVALTGVTAGETLVAIDMRPQNQRLYALGVNAVTDTATLYCISIETNRATPVGTPGSIAFTTDGVTPVDFLDPDGGIVVWDIDFNPAVDRLRVVAGFLNFRVNPNTGLPVDGDNASVNPVPGTNPDGYISGATGSVFGVAYSNNQPDNDGVPSNNVTTLFTVSGTSNSLNIQNPPNVGDQISVGAFTELGTGNQVDVSYVHGFDIVPGVNAAANNGSVSGFGYMVAELDGSTDLNCYRVNLSTGELELLGTTTLAIRSAAVRTILGAMTILDGPGTNLRRFSVPLSGISEVAVGALTSGEVMAGMDSRPSTGQLYALGVNATANTATLYLLDPQTGAATAVGTPGQIAFVDAGGATIDLPDPASSGYGFDFNPVVDRIRVITKSGLNFRLNPITGAAVDGDLGGAAGSVLGTNTDANLNGGATVATATAYTNNFGGATATTLYSFNSHTGNLYIQNPPNSGTLTYVGSVPGVSFDYFTQSGFDIPPSVAVATNNTVASGYGWIVSGRPGGAFTILYRVNLATGAGQTIGIASTNQASGLVAWATPPDITVEQPAGAVVSNSSTVVFGSIGGQTVLSRDFTIRNDGSQPLTYTTQAPAGAEFAITAGAAGSVPGGGTATLTVTYTQGATPADASFTIHSDDADTPSFVVNLSSTPDIAVEQPAGTAIASASTVDFGTVAGQPVLTRDFTIRNKGSQTLNYTTTAPTGAAFAITAGATGSITAGSSQTLTITYAPGTAQDDDSFTINSNDADTAAFTVNLSGPGVLPQTADQIARTTGETRLHVLANDTLGGTLTIVSVSDTNVTISGRTLIIPDGYTGTFTYDVSNGTSTGRGTVTVTAGTAAVAPLKFNGILTDATGKVAGWASVALTTKGVATAQVLIGTSKATKKLTFPTGGNTVSGTVKFGTPAALATVDLNRATAGVVKLTFTDASTAAFTGTLHAVAAPTAAAIKHHIAMATIDPSIAGGAHATLAISKKSAGKIVGVLPDGHAISASSTVTDNGKFAFFAVDKKSKPAAYYGGELTFANLTTTDLTGELVWVKPGQLPTVKGLHLLGEDTVLKANGCLFTGLVPLISGNGTLNLTGGNLAADQSNTVVIAATGIPAVPTGALTAWTGVKQKTGLFSAKVTVPGVTKPVSGKGLYLPKSNRAWGFFPGLTVGGSIELTVP